jgi:hypothetical protein
MLASAWSVLLWPFRLIGRTIERIGHVATAVLGFALMVLGVGVAAATYYWIGLPLFAVGLYLMVRSL